MKALVSDTYGDFKTLRFTELPSPVPIKDEVLVQVRASTVNRTDVDRLAGSPKIARLITGLKRPRLPIRGTEYAGKVVGLGPHARRFKLGDRVYGFHDEGASCHAEQICVAERRALAKIPDGMKYEDIVATGEGPFYAYNYLRNLGISKKSEVLILGVSGGIGSATAMIAAASKARVDGVCPQSAIDYLADLPLRSLTHCEATDLESHLGKNYDFILDTTGAYEPRKMIARLKKDGVFSSTDLGPYGSHLWLSLRPQALGGKRRFTIPTGLSESQNFCRSLVAQGLNRPVVEQIYTFGQIAKAYQHAANGHKRGNLVVTF